MTTFHIVSLVTCVGHLAFAILAASRIARVPIALSLCLLAIDLFALNGADVVADFSSHPIWNQIDHGSSSLLTPLAVAFVVRFVGQQDRLRWATRLLFVYFSAIAAGVVAQPGFGGSSAWGLAVLAGIAAACPAIFWLLIAHLRACPPGFERVRTQLVLLALVGGVGFGTTDLWRIVGVWAPRLTNVGMLITIGALSVAVLRLDLFEQRISRVLEVSALVIGAVAVVGYVVVFALFGTNLAGLVLGVTAVTAIAAIALRQFIGTVTDQRARTRELATLGRLSAQMAHDLMNPIAAVKGSVQFLREERVQGRSIDGCEDHLELLEGQIDRLQHVVAGYERLARVQPTLHDVDINRLVQVVVTGQATSIRTELDPELPRCAVDSDLLEGAIANVVKNAVEAVSAKGAIIVRTMRAPWGARPGVKVMVTDEGEGMNPRVRSQVFEDFYTTKAEGSGLGLPFVRRVMHAHQGEVTVQSEPGRGTTVALWVPTALGERP